MLQTSHGHVGVKDKNRKEKHMLKIVLIDGIAPGKTLVGVQQDGCDPFTKVIEADLATFVGIAAPIWAIVMDAKAKWKTSPRNPVYKKPEKVAAKVKVKDEKPKEKVEDLPLLQGTEAAKEVEVFQPAAVSRVPETEPVAPVADLPLLPNEPVPAAVEETVAIEELPLLQTQGVTEVPSQVKAEVKTKVGEYEYFLQDGSGPFATVQLAMDAMGLDKTTRPQHGRWDRLSKDLQVKIQQRPKAAVLKGV